MHDVIRDMACLLESGRDDNEEEYVKMHDVIRDMAIWTARDHGQRENKLLVIDKGEDMSVEMISKWQEAEKVSIWGKWIWNIDQAPPRCFQLQTLIIRETKVTEVPREFLESMTACLTVLDFSNNDNKSFPKGICNLISLQYLNFSNTCISEMPREMKNLTRLRWLLLNDTNNFLIFVGAIASLPLNVFSSWESSLEKEEEVVEELGHMQGLTDLSINVHKSSSALKIFQSFQGCIRRASIINCEDLTCIPISHSLKGRGNFLHLEVLFLNNCPMLVKMEITHGIRQAINCYCFPGLVKVSVQYCGLLDLSWLMHAPKPQRLNVEHCDSMKKIIGDGIAREELSALRLFSCLEFLALCNLPKLRSIFYHALFFPQGVEFFIYDCPEFRKLLLDSNNARGSFLILGIDRWLAEFEWDPAARVTLEWHGMGPVEEMIYGDAARKIKHGPPCLARIRFLPRTPSE